MASGRPERGTSSAWRAFGPGIIFAGAAVGVSHLVQSTRGGAEFGLFALVVVVGSCLVKWPAFRAGPLYAAATGESLLEGYSRRGPWAIGAFGLLTLLIWFTTLAAVTVVSAGLLLALVPDLANLVFWVDDGATQVAVISTVLLLLTTVGLLTGGYRWLERAMKIVMPTLFVLTLAAMLSVLPEAWSTLDSEQARVSFSTNRDLIAEMVGWMPAPIDIAVWTSLWALAKRTRDDAGRGTKAALLDFDSGYLATMVLAIGFTVLGAGVMHGRGLTFADGAPAFAAQVVDLFAQSLGEWSRPIIAIAAFLTMFSTTVTCVDGFSRTVAAYVGVVRGAGEAGAIRPHRALGYWVALGVGVCGAVVVLFGGFAAGLFPFKSLIGVVTITSFLVAPILAVMNHLCIFGPDLETSRRPGRLWWAWSWLCILGTTAFAVFYVVGRTSA